MVEVFASAGSAVSVSLLDLVRSPEESRIETLCLGSIKAPHV